MGMRAWWWAAAGVGVGIVVVAVVRLALRTAGSSDLPPVSDQWLADHKRDRNRWIQRIKNRIYSQAGPVDTSCSSSVGRLRPEAKRRPGFPRPSSLSAHK